MLSLGSEALKMKRSVGAEHFQNEASVAKLTTQRVSEASFS